MSLIELIYACLLVNFVKSYPRGDTAKRCGYESCPTTLPDKINIHLIPHTHDDVGWLKTVDQYYYGSKTLIQKAGVQYILDSVIQELLKDSKRRFVYVESAYFFKWWNEQDNELQLKIKELVNEGRLEFIGGAWSMNDEATTHYQSIIDQFSLGLRKLNETFGECGRPRIGWQIDPFGHSREMASIFAQMGYDGLFFARIDYQDKSQRMETKTLEFIWRGSENLGETTDIFTGVLYNHYSAPPGFCFDVLCADEPIIDGKHSTDNNVDKKLDEFFHHIKKMTQFYRTNNLMIPMGDDFTYQDANMWFKNMDKLIKYGQSSTFHIFYSTPSCYLKSLHEANITWPTKKHDFFPYSTDPHSFWTGYYTSRPTIKRYERTTNHFLQVCKQLTVLSKFQGSSVDLNLNYLREVMGVMQHHDAITGTEKSHVAHDYERLMYEAVSACEVNTRNALRKLMNVEKHRNGYEFEVCHTLNVSACELSENSPRFMVTLYNPLSHEEDQFVRIPVPEGYYEVTDAKGKLLLVDMIPIPTSVVHLPFRFSTALFELVFKAESVPAMGYDSFIVTKKQPWKIQSPEVVLIRSVRDMPTPSVPNSTQVVVVSNGKVTLAFDENGFLSSVSANGISRNIRQEFLYYEGAVGDNSVFENRSSGAYIFRPRQNSSEHRLTNKVKLEIISGKLVQEVHQIFNEWVSQVIRIHESESYVEFDWLVGPIPVKGVVGKEVVSRFITDINSENAFVTDSNGREMIQRIKNKRESFEPELEEEVAGNYYPVTTKISIEDEVSRMSILTDRAQGGSSLESGVLELMVHRRLMHDDAFGVGEALNEIAYGNGIVIRGKHYLMLGPQGSNMKVKERNLQLKMLLPCAEFFSTLGDPPLIYSYKSIFSSPLPPNVNLMTLEPWGEKELLLRYEHILEQSESPRPAVFNLKRVFDFFNGQELRETTLDGSLWLSDMQRLKFKPDSSQKINPRILVEFSKPLHVFRTNGEDIPSKEFEIILNPMQIRTFILKIK